VYNPGLGYAEEPMETVLRDPCGNCVALVVQVDKPWRSLPSFGVSAVMSQVQGIESMDGRTTAAAPVGTRPCCGTSC
jgi:hypothetical protein